MDKNNNAGTDGNRHPHTVGRCVFQCLSLSNHSPTR